MATIKLPNKDRSFSPYTTSEPIQKNGSRKRFHTMAPTSRPTMALNAENLMPSCRQ